MKERATLSHISIKASSRRQLMLLVVMITTTTMMMMDVGSTSGHPHKKQAVPPGLWKKLGRIQNNSDFIYDHVKNKTSRGTNLTESERIIYNGTAPGFNQPGVDIVAGQVAEPGGCLPTEKSVSIPANENATVIHWPPCTRLPQCGGCCGTDILECVPTVSEPAEFQVMKVVYTASGDFEYLGLKSVTLMKHVECDCRCRIQAHHCNSQTQDYNELSCSCRCRNEHLAASCPSHKIWDEKECACVCRGGLSMPARCLDDELFSFSTCSCQRLTPTVPQVVGDGVAISDPCSRVTCRAGYRAVFSGTSCVCRIQTRSVSQRSRSASAGKRYWARGSNDFDDLFD